MDKTTAQALIIAHLMAGKDFDRYAICAALAAADPVLFCQMAKMEPVNAGPEWASNAVKFLKDNQVIPAIKEIRTGTGMGLKESKDAVDALRGTMSSYDISGLHDSSYNALETMRKVLGRNVL